MPPRGVLLDSGDTLIGPRGSRWNPRFDFEATVTAWKADVPVDRFPAAFARGEEFLHASGASSRRDYHRVVLAELGLADAPDELLAALERPLPAAELVEVFDDVVPALDAVAAAGAPIALVTDNWSSVRRLYEDLGLAGYFVGFVISEEVGCTKPDPRMYRAGSDALGLAPHQCLYVDDDADLVRAAVDLGCHGVVLDRRGTPAGADLSARMPTISTLGQIISFLDGGS